MKINKIIKDYLIKVLLGKQTVPRGLLDLNEYFRNFDPIEFDFIESENGIIAKSKNFRYGSIITSVQNKEELDKSIKDAILTSFDIPSVYLKEAKIVNQSEMKSYALA